ncbi:MAG: hypothetical protein NVS3B10_13790 [Polyangiales bacterium]
MPIDTDAPIFGSRYGRWQPSGAARLTVNEDSFDLGLSLFTGLSREPTFVAELTTGQLVPRYDPIHQAAADAQWSVGGFVLKAEAFVRSGTDFRRVFGGGGAGIERTFRGLVDVWDLTLVGELLYDSRPLGAPITFFEHDAFGGLRLAFNDAASTELTGGAAVDVVDGTTFGRLEAARGFGDHWKAVLGAHVFFGPPGKLESAFRHDDYLQLRIAHYF